MLRILTLSTLFPDASRPTFGVFVERQTLGLAAREGVEVEVVAPLGLPPFPLSLGPRHRALRRLPQCETWKGAIVHRPRFASLPKLPALAPAAMARALLPRLREIRERFPFDVIDAEFFWPDGPAAMQLSAALGIPFSVKARGNDIHYWAGVPGCTGQIVAAGHAAGGVLAVSAALREVMIGFGMPADRIAVHQTGIDRDRFRPVERVAAKAGLGVSGPLVVTVGALIRRKGQALAIDAIAKLPGVAMLMVGAGPDRGRLEAIIRGKGLADRVRLLGARPHAELPGLMAAADILLLMSTSEGLANVWVEALACGTPIVIGDVGGAREVLTSRNAGRLAKFDAAAVADAVRDVLADTPDQEAVRHTVDRFSWDRNAQELEAHLRKVAGR